MKCIFFLLIGQEARNVYNTWALTADEQDETDVLFNKFEEYFKPRKNLRVIWLNFNRRIQESIRDSRSVHH